MNNPARLTSLAQIHADLAAIDDEMRSERVKFSARAIDGFRRFSSSRGLGLGFPSSVKDPAPDDLSNDAVTTHIFDWFDARYGSKQNIVYVPSVGAMDIDGDLFALSVTRIYGQINFEINPNRFTFKYSRIGKARPPKANLLQGIVGMTPAYAASIPQSLRLPRRAVRTDNNDLQ